MSGVRWWLHAAILILGFGNVASQVFLHEGYKREAEYRRINDRLMESLKKATESLKTGTVSLNACAVNLAAANGTAETSIRLLEQNNETLRKVAPTLRACAVAMR